MTVLLDECTPRLLKRRLVVALIRTVQEMGWAGILPTNKVAVVAKLATVIQNALNAIQPGQVVQIAPP